MSDLFKNYKCDITISDEIGGVFTTGAEFENERFKSGLSVTFQNVNFDFAEIEKRQQFITEKLKEQLREREAQAYQKYLEKQFSNIRFRDAGNGEKYPSVTSIINTVNPIKFYVDDVRLKGLAARGTVLDIILQKYIETGEWKQPEKIPECWKHYQIMIDQKVELEGNLQGWIEKYKPEFTSGHYQVINHDHRYGGEPDAIGKFDGLHTVFDLKAFSPDAKAQVRCFKQLAAYAKAMETVPEQLCIISVHGGNKQGYSKPYITDSIDEYFSMFLQDRAEFKEMFNV